MAVMRRAIASLSVLAFVAGSVAPAAADRPVRILIDGRPVMRMSALSHAGCVYVELGGMVRAFSGLVIFEKTTATVSFGNRVAVFTIGSSRANLDGDVIAMGGKAFETDGDFYVPLNFIATQVAHARLRIAGNGSVALITSIAPADLGGREASGIADRAAESARMTRRPALSFFALAAVLCTSALGARADDAATVTPAITGPVVGAPAPDFSLQTLAGKTVSLASFRGKTLVINTWATWCPPCREEMPELIATARTLQKSGVAVLGVDSTEEAPIVRGYVAAHDVSYPQAIDTTKSFSTAYDIEYFPTTFVIDPAGIVRARIVDGVTPKELNALVADANAGRNGIITSPLQTKIDTTLADANFTFTGDADAVTKNARAVAKAIDAAEQLLDASDAASGNATDFVHTRAEEASIRDRAIASLKALSSGVAVNDASLLPILEGDAARDREQWQAAIDAYATVLASDPKNDDALEGTALAAGRLKQYDLVVATDATIASLAPTSTGDLIDLARAQAADGKQSDADATFEKALALAHPAYAAHPGDPKAIKPLASVHLYYGRTLAKAGDAARAREQFEALSLLAMKLPTTDSRHDMYLEEAQEAIVALDLGGTHTGASLSVAPWTGAVLPGSIPDTIKYRVIVAGTAGKTIALAASDVPKGWVASFCSDKICAPFHVSVEIPEGGVKIVEFQLVPPEGKIPAPKVRITSTGDGPQASVTT